MQVKLLCDRVGERFHQSAGSTVSLDRKEALALIASGSAERISFDELETASIGPPENAMKRRGSPRKVKEIA